MNRIRELQEQAFSECKRYDDDCGDNLVKTDEVFAKFAELIVQESCDVLQTEVIMHEGYGYNQEFLHKKIKEHFGIE